MSEQVKYATGTAPTLDQQLEAAFKDSGSDSTSVDNTLSQERVVRQKEVVAANDKASRDIVSMQRDVSLIDSVAGIHTAFRGMVRNTYNGLVTAANAVEDYAATKGLGDGKFIDESNKWTDERGKYEAAQLGQPGKIANALTKVAVPVAAGIVTGAGLLAGVGMDVAYNAIVETPEDANFADTLKGTFVDEVPLFYEAMETVRHKPGDDEMTLRIKNGAAALGFSGALTGLIGGITGASKFMAGKKALTNPKILTDVETSTAKMTEAMKVPPVAAVESKAIPIISGMDNVNANVASDAVQAADKAPATIGTPSEVQALDKLEAAQYVSPDTPEEAALFKQQYKTMDLEAPPTRINETGDPSINLQNDDMLQSLYNASQASPEGVLRTPMTDAELFESVRLARENPDMVNKIINFKPGDLLNDQETLVARGLLFNTETEWQKVIQAHPINPSVEEALAFNRKLEGYLHMGDIVQGNASNKGASLRAEQLAASTYGTTKENALSIMGAQGRANLSKALMHKYAGQGITPEIVNGLKMVAQIPDGEFKYAMGEIVRRTKYDRLENVVTKVALNGMTLLSSKSAAVANTLNTSKLVIDKYVQGLNPLSKTTLQEANDLAHGIMSSLKDGVAEGWSRATAKTVDTTASKLDLVADSAGLINQQERAVRSAFVPWSERGVQLAERAGDVLTANSAATRALVGVDAAFVHTLTQGLMRAEAGTAARAQGILSHEMPAFIDNFVKRPPTEIADKVDKIATTAVLSNPVEGALGKILDFAQEDVLSYVPTSRVIFPFLKTTANSMIQFVENSPFAVFTPKLYKAIRSTTPGVADDAMTKVFTGTLAMGSLMYMAHEGNLTGGFEENKKTSTITGNGVAPLTSVKINGEWVRADNLGWMSSMINISSFLNKASAHISEEEYGEAAQGFLAVMAENISPDNLTDNIAGLANALSGDDKAKTWLTSLSTRYIPFGSGLGAIRNTVDPIKRDTNLDGFYDTLIAKFKNKIPGLSDDLAANRNYFGETITNPPGMPTQLMSIFAPGDKDEGAGMALKTSMDSLVQYQELHKNDPVQPTAIDFKKPRGIVPNYFVDEYAAGATGLKYELQPFEQSAFEKLCGGVDPKTGKPYEDSFGVKMSLRDRFYKTLEKYDLVDTPYNKINPKNYEAAVSELRGHVNILKNEAKNRIRLFGNVQANMNKQAQKAQEFKKNIERGIK